MSDKLSLSPQEGLMAMVLVGYRQSKKQQVLAHLAYMQGYLAHKKTPPPTVGSQGKAFSFERGTPCTL